MMMSEISGQVLSDMGPVYQETNLERWIVEPFNAFSSLSMSLAALLIWLLLVKKDYKSNQFLAFIYATLIFIGGIGSTFFHTFRSSTFFLYLDVIPVFLVTILLSLYYWYKVFPRWYFIVFMSLLIILSRIIPMRFFQGSAAINISYFISGILILIPMIIFMIKTHYKHIGYVLLSVLALSLALFLRYADEFDIHFLPMGTHWLWHIFTGVGAWLLGVYIYRSELLSTKSHLPQT